MPAAASCSVLMPGCAAELVCWLHHATSQDASVVEMVLLLVCHLSSILRHLCCSCIRVVALVQLNPLVISCRFYLHVACQACYAGSVVSLAIWHAEALCCARSDPISESIYALVVSQLGTTENVIYDPNTQTDVWPRSYHPH